MWGGGAGGWGAAQFPQEPWLGRLRGGGGFGFGAVAWAMGPTGFCSKAGFKVFYRSCLKEPRVRGTSACSTADALSSRSITSETPAVRTGSHQNTR